MQGDARGRSQEVSTEATLRHLQSLLESPAFVSSKRCKEFLSYIVLESVHGRGDQISERSIAYEVFGKGNDFEPGEDSLVRVKAREVRKRLSDYYGATSESGIRIEIPLGSYSPLIQAVTDQGPASTPEQPKRDARRFDRRRFAGMLGGTVALVGAGCTYPLLHHRMTPLEMLWQPVFKTRKPLLIFVPLFTDKATGLLTDRVGIGPSAILSTAASFLGKENCPYHIRFGADLTFSQLREQPSLLLGGFSSVWTLRMTRNLRFTLSDLQDPKEQVVLDRQTHQVWKPVNRQPNGFADQDYGIVSRLFDEESGQIVLIAAGVTTFGTEGAANMLFDPVAVANLVAKAPRNWATKNFQAVIRVSILGVTPSIPELVAAYFW